MPDERVENEVGVAKSDEQKGEPFEASFSSPHSSDRIARPLAFSDSQRSLEKPAAILASPDRATTRRTTARGRRGLPPSPPTEYAAARPRRSGTLKRSYEEPQSADEDNNDDGSGTYGVRTSRAPKRICAEKENEPPKTKPKKPKVKLQGRLSATIMALLRVGAGSSVCDGTTDKECGQQLAGSAPEDLVKHLHQHYTSLTDSDTKVLCCMRNCNTEIAPNQLTRHIRQHHLDCEYKCLLPLYAPEHECAFHTKRSDLVRSHFTTVHKTHLAILQAALKGKMPEPREDDEQAGLPQ